MKILVVTITRDPWPTELGRHYHIVGPSRLVVSSVHVEYGRTATVNEYDLKLPVCPECGEALA